jgi:NADPH-dependent F420 reductase
MCRQRRQRLAYRWAYAVSRYHRLEQQTRHAAAAGHNHAIGKAVVRGLENVQAAREAEVIVLTVPYSAHRSTLESIREAVQGKILVDVTVPIQPPVTPVNIPQGRSAAEEAQKRLGERVRGVSAVQTVSAVHLKDLDHPVNCDVLVTGDDTQAKQMAIELAQASGLRGIDAGVLANAVAVEALTSILLAINKNYRVKSAGILITGLDDSKVN